MEGWLAVRGTSDGHASSCLATKITKITKSNSASKSNTVTPSTSKYIKASFQDFQVPMGEVQSEVLPPRCGVALGYPDSSSKLSDMATERRKLQEFCRIFPDLLLGRDLLREVSALDTTSQAGENHAYHYVSCLALEVH